MPGSIDVADGAAISGWAAHPRHPAYPMLVHGLVSGRVEASTLADQPRADGRLGFTLAVPPGADLSRLRVLLGETDEALAHRAEAPPPRRRLSVEDLIATTVRRPWVDGTCHVDAEQAGLKPPTIIDLLCRDYLGRPAGPVVTATGLAALREGGYLAVRRMLLSAGEYRHRRIHADAAPGTIFSQAMVRASAGRDVLTGPERPVEVKQVSALPLLALDAAAFVTACYRSILRKEPDRGGLSHYLHELEAGVAKADIIRRLAGEFETVSAGIEVVDLPPA